MRKSMILLLLLAGCADERAEIKRNPGVALGTAAVFAFVIGGLADGHQ